MSNKEKVMELMAIRNRILNGDSPAILTHWQNMVQIPLDAGALAALIKYYKREG